LSFADAAVVVRDDLDGTSIDRRVLGTNIPAWLGPERLADPAFQEAALLSGVTLVRMPGGSWSNTYEWSACENGDATNCYWTWAARPTDFADFMQATGLSGMWTVSINSTAQSAAAAVAFFNGAVGDNRPIGVDRNGVDWGTVDTWARLRSDHGNPHPVPILLWEVGNEVFGGRPETGGTECADFGWEDVWTCDGTSYVEGDEAHDGYLAIRAAMLAIDPTIMVGAVGVSDPSSWSDWGNEVVRSAGTELDFYVIHVYGFDHSPEPEDALSRPAEMWSGLVQSVRSTLPADVPIAVTEHNLVALESGDTERSMTRAMNALYMADSIGEMITHGVAIANQWNFANGTTPSGTDYGLIDSEDLSKFPQFHALSLWGRAGNELLAIDGNPPDGVHLYPTRRSDGTNAILIFNMSDTAESIGLKFAGVDAATPAVLTTLRADALDSEALIDDGSVDARLDGLGTLEVSLPAWSLNLLEVGANG
jgi:hypothetical protein